jgi:protein phosphatase
MDLHVTDRKQIELTHETPALILGIKSDVGMKRSQNQDYAGIFEELNYFIVADGMGGHQGGETASLMAVEVSHQTFRELKASRRDTKEALLLSLRQANEAILAQSESDSTLAGMGTTVSALAFDLETSPLKAYLAQIGDSRCYLIRQSSIWQLSEDHSLVHEQLRAGILKREQLKAHRMKNVITRSVGFDEDFKPDLFEFELFKNDLLVLCSDGLSGFIEDSELLAILKSSFLENPHPNTLRSTLQQLISLTNSRGGDDNSTVVVIYIK